VFVLDAQAVIERQFRADAPVVLPVAAVIVGVYVERRRQRDRALPARECRGEPEQESGKGVAVGCTAVAAVRRRDVLVEIKRSGGVARVEVVRANLSEVGAYFEGVSADEPRVR